MTSVWYKEFKEPKQIFLCIRAVPLQVLLYEIFYLFKKKKKKKFLQRRGTKGELTCTATVCAQSIQDYTFFFWNVLLIVASHDHFLTYLISLSRIHIRSQKVLRPKALVVVVVVLLKLTRLAGNDVTLLFVFC